jgi:hypothetical protein
MLAIWTVISDKRGKQARLGPLPLHLSSHRTFMGAFALAVDLFLFPITGASTPGFAQQFFTGTIPVCADWVFRSRARLRWRRAVPGTQVRRMALKSGAGPEHHHSCTIRYACSLPGEKIDAGPQPVSDGDLRCYRLRYLNGCEEKLGELPFWPGAARPFAAGLHCA